MRHKRYLAVLLIVLSPLLLVSCGGGGGGGGGGGAGAFTVNTTGGAGGLDGGSGGEGGYFIAEAYYSGMGPVEILTSGRADASFTPSNVTANLGAIPLLVTIDTAVDVYASLAEAELAAMPDGTPFLVGGDTNLYLSQPGSAVGDDDIATGISVAQGVTLTFGLNYGFDGSSEAQIHLNNDIDNRGTITVAAVDETEMGDLNLTMASYIAASEIYTAGQALGQDAGDVTLYLDGSFFNGGSIIASGQDNDGGDGGDGGYVDIYADYRIENTGTIDASGGDSLGGYGGYGGEIYFEANYGSLWNSGDLTANGGDGESGGGNSYWVGLYTEEVGDVLNSGDISVSAGDSSGGHGGYVDYGIDLYAEGGSVINNAALTTVGGSTTDEASSGGDGGYVYLENYYGYLYEYTPAGDILVSGNIDTRGGAAVSTATATGSGGDGGYVDFYLEADYYPVGQRLALLGYDSITTSGGDANYPGDGGYVDIYNDYSYNELTGEEYGPGGDVTNQADITTVGGSVPADATNAATGGSGGYVDLETDYEYGMFAPDSEKVVNTGVINTSSGTSSESSSFADAGSVWIWGYNGVTNSGAITANGGADFGDDGGVTGWGNHGDYVELYAELGAVSNSGALSSAGGDGEYRGGEGYEVELYGATVTNSGAINGDGGDADPLLTGSIGGDGAYVELFAIDGPSGIKQTGAVSNAGGAGATAGFDGEYWLGGTLQ